MKILIGCEFSGIVREEFRKLGHDAWSCDLLDTEIPGNHIKGDVLRILEDGWDMLIAHPPCFRLCNSGVRWLQERDLWEELDESAYFFRRFLNAPIEKVAVENPIPHKYAIDRIGRKYDQIIQPWMFGHGETKATCLWLKNLPLLYPTKIVDGRKGRVHYESPGPDRWKNRSRTLQGIAKAMAKQWGGINEEKNLGL